jgi:CRISPR-associated endonuclease Csn1
LHRLSSPDTLNYRHAEKNRTMRILGVDGGIASVGWAVIDDPMTDGKDGVIIACGSRCFDAPETDKERTPTNQIRRQKRGMRRVIRRRRLRMNSIRALFAGHGLLDAAGRDALRIGVSPWQMRAEGLSRVLTGAEFAAALGHIAAHRGFRSNSKRDRGANAADESSKMLKAIGETRERLGQYQTVGAMFAADASFADRKRNRGGDFSRSVLRDDHADEVRTLFAAQRRLGNGLATTTLEAAYADAAFYQRPLQDSDALVGNCPFEPDEKRAARRGYSFELFRFLSRLNTLKLIWRGGDRRITADELAVLAKDFGKTKKIAFSAVRKALEIDASVSFDGIKREDEKNDVVARSGNAAEGTASLRAALGDEWARQSPDILDRMAEIITFRDDLGSIETGLHETGADADAVAAVLAAVQDGECKGFKGAGHISAKAARAILPGLWAGMMFSEACSDAGYDHSAPNRISLEDIKNPVARKALGEMLAQVRAVIRAYGPIDRIHVELARDVGKSAEERDKIKSGIEKKNKERDRAREQFKELLHQEPHGDDMLRFELWQEQNGRCLYSDEPIPVDAVIASNNSAQIDHILPWSRFGDDSFNNKTLCLAKANQDKGRWTPWEWFEATKSPEAWDAYVAGVEGCKSIKGFKKRGHYLRKNGAEVEENFRNRNLGDTRYATRALLSKLAEYYDKDGIQVLARPGALTSKLRRGWGLQGLKKGADGKRLEDDRHHALDAIVLAATTQAMVQNLTRAFQDAEKKGLARQFAGEFVVAPWPGFRLDAEKAVDGVFVARPERRRVPGEAHQATIKQIRVVDGADVVFVRKAVDKLTEKDLDLIPVPAPYGRIADPAKLRDTMIAAIRDWWAGGRKVDAPPRMANGDVIRKVRVATTDKVAVGVRGGTADRGDMARVDVFRNVNKRGQSRFFLVPIYPHQIAGQPKPPMRAADAGKAEADWTMIDDSFEFRFSLFQNSLVDITKPDGKNIVGYFKGFDRANGSIALASPKNQRDPTPHGARTLLQLNKKNVTRLGVVSEISQEPRTWHGEVCT